MSESHHVELVWLVGLLLVVLVFLALERMIGRGRRTQRVTAGERSARRWLIVPAVLILAVYAARFGIAAGWGRSQAIPIFTLLVLVMLAVLLGNPFRRNP